MRREAQLARAREHTEVPKELELYELPEILRPFSQSSHLSQHRSGVVTRPSLVAGQKYEDVSRAYIRAVHSVLIHQQSAPDAAAALEKELIHITGFRKGPPPQRDWWSSE
jgi:hypothetical protein